MIDCDRLHGLTILLDCISKTYSSKCDPIDILSDEFAQFMNNIEFEIDDSDDSDFIVPELPDFPDSNVELDSVVSSFGNVEIDNEVSSADNKIMKTSELSPIKHSNQNKRLVASNLYAVANSPHLNRKIDENVAAVVNTEAEGKKRGRKKNLMSRMNKNSLMNVLLNNPTIDQYGII